MNAQCRVVESNAGASWSVKIFSLSSLGVPAAVFPSVVHVYKRLFVSMSVYLAEVI